MTVSELANHLDVKRATVLTWIHQGRLKSNKKRQDGTRNKYIHVVTDLDTAKKLAENLHREKSRLKIGDVARSLGVSPETIRQWAHDGMIPAKKIPHHGPIGYRFHFDEKDLPAIKRHASKLIRNGKRGRPRKRKATTEGDLSDRMCVKCKRRPAVHDRVLCPKCRADAYERRASLVKGRTQSGKTRFVK